MLITSRLIDAIKYDSASVLTTDHKKPKIIGTTKQLRISLVRLAVAVAKTMHSEPIKRFEFPFAVAEQISALQRHSASHSKNSKNLRLRDEYFYQNVGVRDFSKNTIEGQYAQAINFLFFQDILGVPAILDFDKYCRDQKILPPPSSIKKPDFVGCKDSDMWLIESKGNLESASIKPELREGLLQCQSGERHLTSNRANATKRSYSSLVSFKLASSALDTTIHYADPENQDTPESADIPTFLRSYYEIAIHALGYKQDPSEIWSSDDAHLFRSISTYLNHNYFDICADDSGGPLFEEHRWKPRSTPEFYYAGISVDIVEALKSGDLNRYFHTVDSFKQRVSESAGESMAQDKWVEEEFFVDGTIVSTVF